MNISFLVYVTLLTIGIGAAIYYGAVSLFNQYNDSKSKKEVPDWPEYIEEEWPHMTVELGKAYKAEFQLKQNDIEFKGPRADSYMHGGPPGSEVIHFEDIETLKKAGAVVWATPDVELFTLDKGSNVPMENRMMNTKTDMYEFIDDPEEVKIV